jgi:hypothetical protein
VREPIYRREQLRKLQPLLFERPQCHGHLLGRGVRPGLQRGLRQLQWKRYGWL